MEKLTGRFKASRSMSSSLDFLNIRRFIDDKEESCLKCLTFSVPVGVLPVFLATTACETESLGRAASSSNVSMESATCVIPRSFQLLPVPSGAVSKCPFRATTLWEDTVFQLENSIKPGRHTSGLRIYESCFRGAEAVACLLTYLNAVLPKTVSLGQVLILCHKLVVTGVMEDVKDKERTMFKEGRLYRFSKEHFWQQPTGALSRSSPTHHSALRGCLSPTRRSTSTPTKRHKIDNLNQTPLVVSSGKYPSDSTIAVSSHTKYHRRSSYEPHNEFMIKERNTKAGQTLKKTKSLLLHWHGKKSRSDPPSEHSDRGNVKLSRRNAMRRVSKPLILAIKVRDQQALIKGKGQQGVYHAMQPAQRSQSENYRFRKEATCITNYCLQRKFTDRVYLQDEKEDMDGIRGNRSKLRKNTARSMKENNHTVKSNCIDTGLQGHGNKPRPFNACVRPVSIVREDALTTIPAPTGMNWVVYGYL